MEAIIIIIMVAIVGGALLFRKKKINDAVEDGSMVKRDAKFFKQSHTFKTNIQSIQDIYNALDSAKLEKNNLKYYVSGNEIVFEKYILGQGMTAALTCVGEDSEGNKLYRFKVKSYTTRKGMEAGGIDANIALTIVEKTIAMLDSSATVERLNEKYMTKW